MRILLAALESPLPATSGHRLHLWALLRALNADQHRVTLVLLSDPEEAVDRQSLGELCESFEVVQDDYRSGENLKRLVGLFSRRPYSVLRYTSEPLRQALKRHLQASSFDAILCDEFYPVTNVPEGCTVPIIADTQHVAYVLLGRFAQTSRNPFLRLYAWLESQKMRRWEPRMCSRIAAVGACSELEAAAFRQLCPGAHVVNIPNVVDLGRYEPMPESPDKLLLYCGAMDWYPNQDAVAFFVSDIFPKIQACVPEVRFIVAGRTPSESFRERLAFPAVRFTGTVPDMRPEFGRAAVFVVPLRIAGGTRVKILEAAAMARPIVSTRIGAEGLDFVDGREIVLADDPLDFGRAVADLLSDPDRRRALGQAARRRVEQQYSLAALRAALRQALEDVTGSQASSCEVTSLRHPE